VATAAAVPINAGAAAMPHAPLATKDSVAIPATSAAALKTAIVQAMPPLGGGAEERVMGAMSKLAKERLQEGQQ
jgi:hypothetical protein